MDYDEQDIQDLEDEVTILRQKNKALEANIESNRKIYLRDLQEKEDELEQSRQKLKKKLRRLEDDLSETAHEKGSERAKRALYEGENDDLKEKLAGIEKNYNKYRRECKKYKALYNDQLLVKEDGHHMDGKKLRALQEELEDCKLEITSLGNAKKQLQTELNDMDDLCQQLKGDKELAENKIKSLQKAQVDNADDQEEKEERYEEIENENRTLSKELSDANTRLSIALEEAESNENRKNALYREVQELRSEIEYHQTKTVSKAKYEKAELEIRNFQLELDSEQRHREKLEDKYSKLEQEFERYQNEALEDKKHAVSIDNELRNMKRKEDEYSEELRQEQKHVVRLQEENRVLHNELEDLKFIVEGLRHDTRTSSMRIEGLQKALDNIDLEDDADDSILDDDDDMLSDGSDYSD